MQWSHIENILERVKGIEPSYSAWEADVLPLNYTRTSPPDVGDRGAKGKRFMPAALLPDNA